MRAARDDVLQERRLVTVLFADIVGFTALADTLDPEELQEIMSGIFGSLAEEAERADGTIEKFIGDAIFVVFGAPVAHEDDAERAVRTAAAMQRRFAEHAAVVRSRYQRELALRSGIHTGIVVAGAVRTPTEYGVMGDTVNVAARLQEQAQPGEILVSQATFRLTNQRFTFREVGRVEMRGRERPVLAYALTGEQPVTARPSVELNTPLVGRWMELSRLDLAYQSAMLERPEVVALSGEPGIGKSRLVMEFLGLIGAGGEGQPDARVLRFAYAGVGVRSYAGFIETLYEAFGVERGTPDATERLARRLEELDPHATRNVSELAVFLGLVEPPVDEGDADEARQLRYAAVREAYAALARERPLVVVLEDLHNADTASVDLLAHLIGHPPRARILFLLTYRAMPDGLRAMAPRANFTSLVLEPLTEEESGRIIEAVLEFVPADLRDRIVERAGGNPFFIEETIRALIESGAIVREGEGWRLVKAPAQLEVPTTLHALVAARLDRLAPLARECIQVASVIGPRFSDRVLRAAAGPQVAAAVEHLIDADLAVLAGPALGRYGRYRFKHAVTQEVAYQTLLLRRRVELHRRVAEAIEQVFAEHLDEHYVGLAHHYGLAEVYDRAAQYAWRAAKAATEAHAHGEAVRHAEQAAALFERSGLEDEAVRTHMLAARVHRYRGDTAGAGGAYRRALAIAERTDPRGPRVRELYAVMAEASARWGVDVPDLEAFIARGLELVGEERTRERALLLVARAFAVRRTREQAREALERSLATAHEALDIAEELGDLEVRSIALDAVGYAQRGLLRFADALATHEKRIAPAQTLKTSDELIDAHTMVADCGSVVGSLGESAEHARIARELAAATGKDQLRRQALYGEMRALLLASEFRAVLELARELVAIPARHDAHFEHGLAFAVAAAAALADPSERELRERLVSSEARASALAAADFLAAFYGLRPGAATLEAVRASDWPSAVTARVLFVPVVALGAARWGIEDGGLIAAASDLAERAGHPRGQALVAHARALRLASRTTAPAPESDAGLAAALAAYERLALPFEQALCLLDRAQLRPREAAAFLERARAIADRIGGAPLFSATSVAVEVEPKG